jgi:hypothetical protein
LVLVHEPRLGRDAILHVPDVDTPARNGRGFSHPDSTIANGVLVVGEQVVDLLSERAAGKLGELR